MSKLLLLAGLSLSAYVAIALAYHRFGDLGTSCRDAREIAVDGAGQIYCSSLIQGAVKMFSPSGHFVRSVSLDTLGGGLSLHETEDGRISVYLFRAYRHAVLSYDGTIDATSAQSGPFARLQDYPTTTVNKGGAVYSLEDGKVYRTRDGRRTVLIASRTPWIVPGIPWVLITPTIIAFALLAMWASGRAAWGRAW